MITNKQKLTAAMEGATAALEGRSLDANTYPETDDLHFHWLEGWTSARMAKMKSKSSDNNPQPNKQHHVALH